MDWKWNPPALLSASTLPCTKMSNSDHSSPEFEFWRVTDHSSTHPNVNLISADELFHDGILLPLDFLHLKPEPNPPLSDPPAALTQKLESKPGPGLPRETASKRWSNLFRKCENKQKENKKTEKKTDPGSDPRKVSSAAAELSINIWPFSRSKSAGNPLTRPIISFRAPITRKNSSGPCSRVNSAGESKSRNWPRSSRVGVHLGRSSPVWQVRSGDPTVKTKSGRVSERMIGKREIGEVRRGRVVNDGNKPKVLNLNVPVLTGYRSRLSCRNDESNIAATSTNSRFGFRNLFIKKVH